MKITATTTSSFSLFVVVVVALAAVSRVVDASGGKCACEVEELGGWAIDCSDTQAMLDSLDYLKSNSCGSDCSSEDCERAFYVVQAHHDFCPEADLPPTLEDGFHDFDEVCTSCGITRSFVEGAPPCPPATCEDQSGNEAYTALVENGCNMNCNVDVCRDLFLVLRVVHDGCDHDVLSHAAEDGLHDLERPCADVICNDPNGGLSQLVCDEEHDDHGSHDHGHEDHHDSHDDHSEDEAAGFAAASIGLATLAVAGTVAAALVV